MKYEITMVPLAELEPNVGQVEGLPMNPRQWTQGEVNRIAQSLEETPELFAMRPIIAVLSGGKKVILGGNLRYEGSRKNGYEEVPCIVLPEDTPVDKMKQIVIKDNGSFGDWDFDALANEWDDLPLTDWGVPAWNVEDEVDKVQKDEELIAKVPFTEVLNEEHNYICLFFDNEVDWLQAQTLFDIHPVKALPTKRGGTQSLAFQKRIGVGRVINGAKAIEKLLQEKEAQG